MILQPDPAGKPDCVILVPTLNEGATICAVLNDLLADGSDWPILIIDGGSTDGTRDLVRGFAKQDQRVRLIDNPARVQSAAINLGARIAAGLGARIILRADGHARYPRGFAAGLVRTLDSEQCDSVVTPLIAQLSAVPTAWAKASVTLQQSWLGTGGARHRQAQSNPGPVAHGHHAAFRLAAFLAIGGYDTDFAANEDAEFDLRLTRAGGKIYLQPRWPVFYVPRQTLRSLCRQYWRNGRWRMMTARKHAQPPGLRQIAPIGLTLGIVLSVTLAPVIPWAGYGALVYLGVLIGAAARLSAFDAPQAFRIATLAGGMHLGFGAGALATLCALPIRPSSARAAPA